MMKFRILNSMLLFLCFMSSSAWSQVQLKDASEIQGVWFLEEVAMSLKAPRVEEKRTWEFRADGKLITSGPNRYFKGTDDTQTFDYKVVNGKIIADNPGRPGKTLDYVVYEKSDNAMILQGGLEGFYFFKKK